MGLNPDIRFSRRVGGPRDRVAGLGLIVLTFMGAQVLPAAALGGALGGSFRRPS